METEFDVDQDIEIMTAPKYKVIFFNDDVTTFEFVIEVLMSFFNKTMESAEKLAMTIHHTGSGVAGLYAYDIARTKMQQTITSAREANFPLKVTIEPAD
ncbi:MAG: ATP-dependent Clp protease adaptor ClpS [Treponemataceae bacterium]|nr:ATP-dependent Clp protease adaptor ClpS [Treponemataceae bacterium]